MSRDTSTGKKGRLWILTEVYFPEMISTGYYLTTIAEGLAKSREVKVLTGQPKHMSRGAKAPAREVVNDVEIFRAAATTFDKNVFFLRLVNMLTIGVSVFVKSLLKFRRGDHVLVVTAPPSLPVTTALACLARGAGYTLCVQDSYPEILVAVGLAKPDAISVRLAHFVNQWVYKHASRIIVMGRDMKELFELKTASLGIPVEAIPNWADLDLVEPRPRSENELLKELGILDKFVFLYAGNIGRPTDVETIAAAAVRLKDNESLHFLFIGEGVKKSWLEAEKRRHGLTNMSILDYRTREQQSEFLNACDVGLVGLIRGMKGTAMPSRTYNLMAAGKPILALTEHDSELARVIDEDGIGTYVEPGDVDAFVASALKMSADHEEIGKMGARARAAALSKYSPAEAVEAYAAALR
jgi:glycosyltransferase involved in cell wall biosynthesis